jgi:hypothetical protein
MARHQGRPPRNHLSPESAQHLARMTRGIPESPRKGGGSQSRRAAWSQAVTRRELSAPPGDQNENMREPLCLCVRGGTSRS